MYSRISTSLPASLESLFEWREIHRRHISRLLSSASNFEAPAYLCFKDKGSPVRDTVVFFNCIGGLGDSIPMLLLMKLYKKYHPEDIVVLYDSLYLGHYYDLREYADHVVQASEHIFDFNCVRVVTVQDPSLPVDQGKPLSALNSLLPTKMVSTHHAHRVNLPDSGTVLKIDYGTALVDSVLAGCLPMRLRPRPWFAAEINRFMEFVNPGKRMLIGVQNRALDPYETHQLRGELYKAELEDVAAALQRRHSAQIVTCGDLRLCAPSNRSNSSAVPWVDLDCLRMSLYLKLEVMRRSDLLLGASSGFAMTANFMREPNQIGGVPLFMGKSLVEGSDNCRVYPNFIADGGGVNVGKVVWTYQHPLQRELLLDMNQSSDKILDYIKALCEDYAAFKGATRWLVPHS